MAVHDQVGRPGRVVQRPIAEIDEGSRGGATFTAPNRSAPFAGTARITFTEDRFLTFVTTGVGPAATSDYV
jgi:hypothetical protein